jgi:hypothetical protein
VLKIMTATHEFQVLLIARERSWRHRGCVPNRSDTMLPMNLGRFAAQRPKVRWTGRSAVPAWRIRNVHERLFQGVPPERVEPLFAALGSPQDVLWPGGDWSPMVLDGPLAEGARGGHGNVRYTCRTYLPGRLVEFVFDSIHGRVVDGRHVFESIPRRAGTLVRHTLDLECGFTDWRELTTRVAPLHDAVLEQFLDNLEHALTGAVAQPHQWSRRVVSTRRSLGLPAVMKPKQQVLGHESRE